MRTLINDAALDEGQDDGDNAGDGEDEDTEEEGAEEEEEGAEGEKAKCTMNRGVCWKMKEDECLVESWTIVTGSPITGANETS